MGTRKIFLIGGLIIGLGAGLYAANHFWIAPLAANREQPAVITKNGNHPIAPDFTLKSIDGQTIHLADYKGKVLMVDFWATDCGPCRLEIPGFVELQDRYRDQGFAILGVSLDVGPAPVRDFYREFKMNYTVGMDEGDLDERFGVSIGIPTTFLIGRDGRIYSKHVGATDPAVFEKEIKSLLGVTSQTRLIPSAPANITTAELAELPMASASAR